MKKTAYAIAMFRAAAAGSGVAAAAPTFSSITPATGDVAGGEAVVIAGTGFSGSSVTIGGAACTSVVTDSSIQISCNTPAGTDGAKDVVVTNGDTQIVTGSSAFTYTGGAAPVIARTASDEDDDAMDVTLTFSPAPADGVLLVACAESADGNFSPPAGWTTITANRAWYKIASSEPTTFLFPQSGSKGDNGGSVAMAEITGNAASSPIEDTDAAINTVTTPAGTTLGSNRLAVALATDGSNFTSMTNSWTIAVSENVNGSRKAAIGYKSIAAAGSTGTSDWDVTANNTVTLCVKP